MFFWLFSVAKNSFPCFYSFLKFTKNLKRFFFEIIEACKKLNSFLKTF
eukprot:UN23836